MKKIPTLFQREFVKHKIVNIHNELTDPNLQWVLDGEGTPTEKIDGACCTIIEGVFYRRFDVKKKKDGSMKAVPEGAIPCDDPDPVTGHWPHWKPVQEGNPDEKWYLEAKKNADRDGNLVGDWTYEAIGPHFQGNPYGLLEDTLVPHGKIVLDGVPRTFEGIKEFLDNHLIEGIVFWKDNQPQCKIKRSDFGFEWPKRQNTLKKMNLF